MLVGLPPDMLVYVPPVPTVVHVDLSLLPFKVELYTPTFP